MQDTTQFQIFFCSFLTLPIGADALKMFSRVQIIAHQHPMRNKITLTPPPHEANLHFGFEQRPNVWDIFTQGPWSRLIWVGAGH